MENVKNCGCTVYKNVQVAINTNNTTGILKKATLPNQSLLCIQIRVLRGQKPVPSSRVSSGSGSTNYQDLCLASPASVEGDYLSSDDDLLPSPLPPSVLYPPLSGPCQPSARLDSEGSTDSEAEERVRTRPDPQQLYGSMMCAEALDN